MNKKSNTVLVLRTCNADMTAYGGFKWPKKGPVKAPDWNPAARCGNGLHGLAKGLGDANLMSWDPEAKWLVVEVLEKDIVDLGGKVKFPKGRVIFAGDRKGATDILVAAYPGLVVHGAYVVAGYRGTATSWRGTEAPRRRGTGAPRRRGTGAPRRRGTGAPRRRGTGAP